MPAHGLTGMSRGVGHAASSFGSSVGAARAWLGRAGLVREVLLVALAMLVYFGIRNLTVGNADAAAANADRLLRLEHGLGVAWEGEVQDAAVDRGVLVDLANWVYIWGHWPVILTTAVVLYLRRPRRYYLLRNAMFLSGGIGFAFFALLPVAPPRLLDMGLVDTVTERSQAYRALQPPGLTNQYAAFPSLHFGWNVLLGVVVVLSTTVLVIRVAAVLLPLAMGFAVIATANHYVLDVAGGLIVVLVALAVVTLGGQRGPAATLVGDGAPRGATRRPSERVAVRRRTPGG
jgi:PAP2 superfamily